MQLNLRKATNRNTQAYILNLGNFRFYISYETIIGCATYDERVRLRNSWGPTTGRHINDMGIHDFKEVDDHYLSELVKRAIVETAGEIMEDKLHGVRHPL